MSSILKALEKVEQSQSTRRSGSLGVARSRERRPAWTLPAAILGGAAAAALATFAAMGGLSRQEPPRREVGTVATPALPPAPVLQPPAAARNEAGQAPKPGELREIEAQGALHHPAPAPAPPPKAVARKGSEPLPRKAAHPAAVVKTRVGVKSRVAVKQVRSAREVPTVAARTPLRPSAGPVAAAAREGAPRPAPVSAAAAVDGGSQKVVAKRRPEIRVTGIAWQKDGSSSAAIVNGHSVEQGGVVDGYRVEQIHENKVIFSRDGGRFEIPLGAGE